MAKTASERQKTYRANMRRAGFKRLTIWVPEEFRDTFYDMFRELRQQWADREPTNE